MTTETVKYVIEAEDRATPVWKNLRQSVASTDAAISHVASEAQYAASGFSMMSTAVGTVAPSLKGVSDAATGLTGILNKLRQSGRAGSVAILAMKAGAISLGAVIAGQLVNSFAKWASGYDAVLPRIQESNDALAETVKFLNQLRAGKLGEEVAELATVNSDDRKRALEDILAKLSSEDAALQLTIKRLGNRIATEKSKPFTDRFVVASAEKEKELREEELQGVTDRANKIKSQLQADALAARVAEQKARESDSAAAKSRLGSIIGGLREELGILKEGEKAYQKRKAITEAVQAGGFRGGAAAALMIAERDKLLEREDRVTQKKERQLEIEEKIRDAWREQVAAFRESVKDRLAGQQAGVNALANLKEQLIALRDGEAAARAFSLEQSGIEGGTASQIARMEEQLRQAQAGQEVKTNTASESRLLSGRVEMDAARQTANATARVRELTEKIWKQNEAMLATQEKIAKNTETQLETLR